MPPRPEFVNIFACDFDTYFEAAKNRSIRVGVSISLPGVHDPGFAALEYMPEHPIPGTGVFEMLKPEALEGPVSQFVYTGQGEIPWTLETIGDVSITRDHTASVATGEPRVVRQIRTLCMGSALFGTAPDGGQYAFTLEDITVK